MKNTVVYHNDLNLIPLQNFNSNEMNILFALCTKMKDKGLSTVTMTFQEIKQMCDYDRAISNDDFSDELERVFKKLLNIVFSLKTKTTRQGFTLFTKYLIDTEKRTVEMKLNEEFSYFLNELSGNFTKFELIEFSSLSSIYSKTAYRLLKQFRKQGVFQISIEEFKEKFCIPKSYQMSDLDKRVFKPIKNELNKIFKGLEIKKIKAKKGRKIEALRFYFIPENDQLVDGTFLLRDGENYIKKSLLEMSDEEIKKIFPNIPEHIK